MIPPHDPSPAASGRPAAGPSGLEADPGLLAVLPAAVYTCDPDGYLAAWNPAAAALWGAEPVAGKTRWCGSAGLARADGAPLRPEDSPPARALREGRPIRGEEIVLEGADGGRRRVICSAELLRDPAGKLKGAVIVLAEAPAYGQGAELRDLASRLPYENPYPVMRLARGRVIAFANPASAPILEEWKTSTGGEAPAEVTRLAAAALRGEKRASAEISACGRVYMVRSVAVPPEGSVNLYFNDVTGLKRAEEALRVTEQRFRTLAVNAPVAIYTKDAEGRYTLANPIACDTLGKSGGVEGMTDHEMLPAELADILRAHDLEVIREGKAVAWEERVSDRKFLSSKFPLLDAGGQAVGVCGVSVDITERSEAERLLRESEQKFRTLANHAPVGIFLSSPGGDALFVNGCWCEMAGIPPEEALGRGWTKALHPEDRERVLSGWEAAVRDHRSSDSEFRFLKPDGGVTWVQGSALRLLDAGGNPAGYIGSCVDITGRKRSEAMLAEITETSEKKRRLYEGLLTTTPDLAFVFGLDHRITYANEALLAVWGKTLEEAVGKTCLELGYEPWHAAMHDREIEEVAATRRPIRGEVPFHGEKGRRIYDYIFSPVLGADGEVEAIAGIARDVTDRKLVQDRHEFLSELSGRLAPVTRESEIIALAVEAVGRRLRVQRSHFVECIPGENLAIVKEDWVKDGSASIVGTYALYEFGGGEWWERVSTGQFAVEDVRNHPLTRESQQSYLNLDILSYAAQSFQADERRTVVLAVTSDQPRIWTEDELLLLENVLARVWPLVERARSEEALRDSRHRLGLVSDHVPALISYLDREEIFHFANGKYREWFGVLPSELEGKPLRHLIGEDTYRERLPFISRVLRGEAVKFEGLTLHRGLGWRDLELSYVPDFGPDQQVRGFYAMAMDITERKQTEKRLERQAARLTLLWEAAGVILSSEEPELMLQRLFGKISRLLEVDTFFNFMVSESGEALELRSCHGITPEQRRDLARLEFGQAICGTVARQKKPIVACSIHESDHPLVQLVKAYGIRAYACNPLMAGDELIGTLSFASRTRTEFEPEEVEFMETISHYVTGAYVRWRLVEDLRAGDRRKDEFLATLAHELRNPLAPIRTGLEVMRMAGGNPEAMERVRATMERQVEQLVTLVNDLLDVSRITRGKLRLRKVPADPGEILRNAVDTSRPVLEEAGHGLVLELPQEPLYLEADPHRLAQVVSNLLNNAAKYTPAGGRITLRAGREDGGIRVEVEDDGIGIPSVMLGRIFDMFTQIDSPDGGDYGGLGIGLTLVKSLVELHGGSVRAASAGEGCGSTFSFTLPLSGERPTNAQAAGAGEKAPAARHKVLVVDDNEAAVETLAMAIELMGHEVKIARNGREGVDLAGKFLPDIVLMDLGMPVMDGWAAARHLRGQPWAKNLVIAALSGWGQEEDRRKTAEAGFDHHLVKPATPAAIRELLARLSAPDPG